MTISVMEMMNSRRMYHIVKWKMMKLQFFVRVIMECRDTRRIGCMPLFGRNIVDLIKSLLHITNVETFKDTRILLLKAKFHLLNSLF